MIKFVLSTTWLTRLVHSVETIALKWLSTIENGWGRGIMWGPCPMNLGDIPNLGGGGGVISVVSIDLIWVSFMPFSYNGV